MCTLRGEKKSVRMVPKDNPIIAWKVFGVRPDGLHAAHKQFRYSSPGPHRAVDSWSGYRAVPTIDNTVGFYSFALRKRAALTAAEKISVNVLHDGLTFQYRTACVRRVKLWGKVIVYSYDSYGRPRSTLVEGYRSQYMSIPGVHSPTPYQIAKRKAIRDATAAKKKP